MHDKGAYVRGQRVLAMMISLICILLLLAACGTNGSAITTTGSGSNTTQTGASATTAPTRVPTKTPATQNCGIVHTMRLLIVPADQNRVKGVEDCFWQAYQQCHPATMTYSQASVDSGMIHNFSLKSANGKCVITDGVQHFIAPRPPQTATNYTCTGLTRPGDGLHFMACGEVGDVVVPAGSV